MKLIGVGEMITPEARLPIELEFSDAYGLATAELMYHVWHGLTTRESRSLKTGDTPAELHEELIPLPTFKPLLTNFIAELSWPVSAAVGPTFQSVKPQDRLTLSARASDFDTVSGPNHARSPDWILRVVTRDELLAELARREQEYRMDFGRLIDHQEQLRGQLLTVFGRHRDSDRPGTLSTSLAPLERRQRNIAGSVNVVRQQFEQIWAELQVNQLDDSDARERLVQGIIAPLTRLAKRDLIAAADALRRWARDGSAEAGSLVDPQQAAVLAQMREVLAFMIQWEGYNELVNMLRDIVRLQGELKEETQEALLEGAGDVFED
jgi:hypothetical protein